HGSAPLGGRAGGAGLPAPVFQTRQKPPRDTGTRALEQRGLVSEAEAARWIEDLPKPVGLMACNDIRGQQVLNACREVEIAVPEDVAVLGVDNADVLCDLSYPPLSSVAPATHRIGLAPPPPLPPTPTPHPPPPPRTSPP